MPQSKLHSKSDRVSLISAGGGFDLPPHLVWGALALIVAATFVAYWPALGGALIWNDSDYVTKPELRSVQGLGRIWFDVGATEQYYPFLHSFFWIQAQLWGDQPLGYHLVNLALHATAVCLLFLILRRLQIPGALLAAAIFALHPVMVETVAWITEQKNTLSTALYLGALLVYLHFDETRKPRLYAAALALFVLAVASKTVTATLPGALLVIFWWQRGTISWRRDVQPLLPWFGLGIVAGLFTAWVEWKYIGAQGMEFELTAVQRFLIAGRVPWFYASKLLWPENLIFMYPRWEVSPTVSWQWLYPLATVGLIVVLWQFRDRWRGPLACWLLFVGTLVPVLGFLNVYWFIFSFAADHLQYLATPALIVLAAAGIELAIVRLQPNLRWIGNLFCLGLLGVLGMLTSRHVQMFVNDTVLYQTTIARNPNCWIAYNNLGIVLADGGHSDEAIANYEKSLQLKPNNDKAHNNYGITLAKLGRQQEAIEHYQKALEINPYFASAQNNWGLALLALDRTQDAIEHFYQAIRIDPNFADAHHDLGVALGKSGQLSEAVHEFKQAIHLQPNNVQTYANLMFAYAQLQRPNDVIETAQKASQVARAQGQLGVAQQIEAWLANYRASQSGQSGQEKTPKSPAP